MAAKKPVVRKKPAKGKVPPQFAKKTVAPATVPKGTPVMGGKAANPFVKGGGKAKATVTVAKKGKGKMPAGLAAFLAKKKTGK